MAGKQGTRGEQNRNRRQKEPSMRIRLGKLGEIGSKLTLNLTDCGCDWKEEAGRLLWKAIWKSLSHNAAMQ